MYNKSESITNKSPFIFSIISWMFGIAVFTMGLINTAWGNDTGFGIFLILLSFIYFLPVNDILKKIFGFTIPYMGIIKFLLGLFIIWAALGVGELFDKIELMKRGL